MYCNGFLLLDLFSDCATWYVCVLKLSDSYAINVYNIIYKPITILKLEGRLYGCAPKCCFPAECARGYCSFFDNNLLIAILFLN